jgi:hypothetical protein
VATTLVVNYLVVQLGYYQKPNLFNWQSSGKDLIMRAPTEWSKGGKPTPFPLMDEEHILEDWVNLFEEAPNAIEAGLLDEHQISNRWVSDSNKVQEAALPNDSDLAITEGDGTLAALNEDINDELVAHGLTDAESNVVETAFHLVPLRPRRLNRFEEQYLGANIFGRAYLTMHDLHQSTQRIRAIRNNCTKRIVFLEQARQKILKQTSEFQAAKLEMEKELGQCRDGETSLANTESSFEAFRNDPDLQQYLRSQKEVNAWGRSQPQVRRWTNSHGGGPGVSPLLGQQLRNATPYHSMLPY